MQSIFLMDEARK